MKPILGLLLALAACDLPPLPTAQPPVAQRPTVYRTVSYFDNHPAERAQIEAWCGDNSGLAVNIPTCDNSSTSAMHARNDRLWGG